MIVAIDGPAGSGKSTTARAVAARLGWLYLDTGAMFRAVALAFLRAQVPPTEAQAERLLPSVTLDVRHRDGAMHLLLNGEDVTGLIRTPEVGELASRVATLGPVRAKLLDAQRHIGRSTDGGVVLDGRDIGTVVFPDADVKIFMVADPRERARRRQAELAARGTVVPLPEVLEEMERRDRQDRGRTLAPLRQATDAVVLDTTRYAFDEQVQFVIDQVRERENNRMV